jgi:hypothetical protein
MGGGERTRTADFYIANVECSDFPKSSTTGYMRSPGTL